MTDFSDYVSNNTNDYFQLTGYSGDDLKIVIKPLSSGGVAAGTAENGSATQGVASNMPVYPDSRDLDTIYQNLQRFHENRNITQFYNY